MTKIKSCWGACRLHSILFAQDRDDVLSLAEQSHDIKMVFTLEIEPTHRKPCNSPGAQSGDFAQLAQTQRTDAWCVLNRSERGDCSVEHLAAQGQATF